MDWKHLFDRLEFEYNQSLDYDIHSQAGVEAYGLVLDRQDDLSGEGQANGGELVAQALLVNRLDEARPEMPVHLNGRAYDPLCQFGLFQHGIGIIQKNLRALRASAVKTSPRHAIVVRMAFRKKLPFIGSGGPRFAADWLVVGLGNPGEQYARTRHNVGWWVINELARRAGTQPKTAGSTMAIGVGRLDDQRVALIKPKTFVNLSGKALLQAHQWTGCDAAHTIVLYDDLDMNVGAIRIRLGGGHGGHNGLKSIGQAIGFDFVRIRIGIGRPHLDGEPTWDPEHVQPYVLGVPAGDDKRILDETTTLVADAVQAIMSDGVDAAGNRFNRR